MNKQCEHGNSGCCCLECCSTGHQVHVPYPKPTGRERVAKFQQDEWTLLLRQGGVHTDTDPALRPPDPQNTEVVGAETPHQPTLEQRTRRARQLTHQGELSAARQALTTGPLAPHTQATLQELRDPSRRPQQPYQALPIAIQEFQPAHPPNLPATQLLTEPGKGLLQAHRATPVKSYA